MTFLWHEGKDGSSRRLPILVTSLVHVLDGPLSVRSGIQRPQAGGWPPNGDFPDLVCPLTLYLSPQTCVQTRLDSPDHRHQWSAACARIGAMHGIQIIPIYV